MTMHITIETTQSRVLVTVKDDTGRDETAVIPRYPHPDSKGYVKWVDALDKMMAEAGGDPYVWPNEILPPEYRRPE